VALKAGRGFTSVRSVGSGKVELGAAKRERWVSSWRKISTRAPAMRRTRSPASARSARTNGAARACVPVYPSAGSVLSSK